MISRTNTEHDSNLLSNLSITPLGLVMGPAKIWKAVKAPKYFWLLLRPSGFMFQMFYTLQKPFFSHYRSSAAACWPCLEWHCIFSPLFREVIFATPRLHKRHIYISLPSSFFFFFCPSQVCPERVGRGHGEEYPGRVQDPQRGRDSA